MRGRLSVAVTVLLCVLAAGCGVDAEDFEDLPSRAELISGSPAPTEPTPEPAPASDLPGEWYVDSNGNRVPDLVAERLGWDPAVDRCVLSPECGDLDALGDTEVPLRAFNTLVLLDASGSMMDEVRDGQKMDLAKEALQYYVTGIPETTDIGLVAYGHIGSMAPDDREMSCEGVEVIGDLGEVTHETLPELIEPLGPTGFTPLGLALEEANIALQGHGEAHNRVVVVSDGQETCGGDPVAAAEALHESELAVVDVLAFDVPADQLSSLEEIAEAGGGDLVIAADGAELREALRADLSSLHYILGTQACVLNESVAVKGCLAAQQTHVTLAFDELLREGQPDGEPWDDEQREEIIRIRNESELWNIEEQRLVEGQALPSIDELGRALRDARERLEDAYDENLDPGSGQARSGQQFAGTAVDCGARSGPA